MQQNPILPQSQTPMTTLPPTPQQDFGKTRSHENWRGTLSTILILIIAPLIALLLTAFVFQSYEVDGPSMEMTLQNRDRLIVWKVPKTISRVSGKDWVPDRGDIVVFVKHGLEQGNSGEDKQLIKRVIGLPGERIVIRGSTITVYNTEHPEGFNPDAQGGYTPISSGIQESQDIVVPTGEIFVAGDNRPNSLDSRAFGTVPVKDVVGSLAYRIFPINKAEKF